MMPRGCTASGQRLRILRNFQAGEFEKALMSVGRSGLLLQETELHSIACHFRDQMKEAQAGEDWTSCRIIRRRMDRFEDWIASRFSAKSLIPRVELSNSYHGKILLVRYAGGVIGERVCLRSNDLNHHDILRNAENEIRDLGLWSTGVHELGGALVEVRPGSIRVWGGSDEFGACDKRVAAQLAGSVFGGRKFIVED